MRFNRTLLIAMDSWGDPIGLFCTNRWVTAEAWYSAEQVIAMLDRFIIDHASPNWAVNRWISAIVRLYRPHIEALIRQRDQAVAARQHRFAERDIFEDRELDITSYLPISVDTLVEHLGRLQGNAPENFEFSQDNKGYVITKVN